ncbi:hypothetical protein SAMN02746041_03164, partial [Desulfacinum hydrothermale DSM 13146]
MTTSSQKRRKRRSFLDFVREAGDPHSDGIREAKQILDRINQTPEAAAKTAVRSAGKTAPKKAPESAPKSAPETAVRTAPKTAGKTAGEAAAKTAVRSAGKTAVKKAPESAPKTAGETANAQDTQLIVFTNKEALTYEAMRLLSGQPTTQARMASELRISYSHLRAIIRRFQDMGIVQTSRCRLAGKVYTSYRIREVEYCCPNPDAVAARLKKAQFLSL